MGIKIKVGDRVKISYPDTTIDGEIGTVENVYPFADMAIVKLENRTVKVHLNALIPATAQTEQEVSTKTIPDDVVEISKTEFAKAVAEAIDISVDDDPVRKMLDALVVSIVGAKIAASVFEDLDTVVMTKPKLVEILWDGCSPERMCDHGGERLSVNTCILVSISAFMTLRHLVEYFFPEPFDEDA